MTRVGRLLGMSGAELAWRARERARIHRDRVIARVKPPRWDRGAIERILSSSAIEPALRACVRRGNWDEVHRALAGALRARAPRFVLDPATADELRGQILAIWPHAAADAARRGDAIMGGRYDLLGYRDLSFAGAAGEIDWHLDPVHGLRSRGAFWADVRFLDARNGDHKVIWEINRHQHWMVLGRALWLTRDRRYGWAIVSQLESWLCANPPLSGVNWASMLELSLRSLSWIWALHFLLADTDEGARGPARTPWLVDLLVGLDRQLRHVEQNLSKYFSPNTHLTGEALALYVAGLALPELAGSGRWWETGRRHLLQEIDAQIGADGGHHERSTHYQRYTLDFYLLALSMAEMARDDEAIARLTDAAARLADFTRTLADDEGRLPHIGDDDGGMLWPIAGRATDDVRDTLALAAVLLGRSDLAPWGVAEETFWVAGRTAIEQAPFVEAGRARAARLPSRTLADAGYVVARNDTGGHLVFDVGALGYLNCGHAHADALAITLTLGGRPLLVDAGTCTYTMDQALRDRFRGTASHNTLTLDNQPSAVPAGPFHWHSRSDAQLDGVRHNPVFDWIEGSHRGFARTGHRRTVFRSPSGGWLVVDEVLGRGRHAADLYWHFDPAWAVIAHSPARLRAVHTSGVEAWLAHDAQNAALRWGDRETGLGWVAPVYGALVPAWGARVARSDVAPFSIATWIAGGPAAPALSRVPVDGDPGGDTPIAVRVLCRDLAWTILLRPGEAAVRDLRECCVDAYQTDARLLQYGARDGRLVSLAACDATHVLALRDGWLSVAADAPFDDVCIELRGERIDVFASRPAARLHLQGALVARARRIRLNGRDLPPMPRVRDDSVLVMPWSWGEARLPGVRTLQSEL